MACWTSRLPRSLLPSLALTVILQLVSSAIFCAANPPWNFGDAIYWCWVTATTVGYGDVSNETQAGRLWACFHILLSVAMLGEIITTSDNLRAERQQTFARSMSAAGLKLLYVLVIGARACRHSDAFVHLVCASSPHADDTPQRDHA